MSLKYTLIAPLIVPKLKKGLNSPTMKNFCFYWHRNTGEQTVEFTDADGTHLNTGQISITEIMHDKVGNRLIDLLDGLYQGWDNMYGIIDIEKRKITLIFKQNGNTIGIRTY